MGKGGDKIVDESNLVGKTEVLIDGKLYDMKDFKHPGGTIIKFYFGNGIDATEAFQNFHIRSKKAKKVLERFPSRDADMKVIDKKVPGQIELIKDFQDFTHQLEKEGFFKPDHYHVLYRVTEIIVMHAIGFWLLFHGYTTASIVILGIVSGRCGWLMHEGGHYSLTGNISTDRTLQILLYGFGCGMSGSWWRSQHNRHHAMPQKLDHDVDLNTLPLVAFTSRVLKKMGITQKIWIRMQAYMFPIFTTLLVALGWQFYLHPRHIVRVKNTAEGLTLLARYALWSLFITSRFGLLQSTLIYLAYTWIGANYIFLNFAVSHTHLPTVEKDDTKVVTS
jgi:fatty acid desaturase